MPDLKPYPFCGSDGVLYNSGNHWPQTYYRVLCKRGCCVMGTFHEEPEKAVEAWNRRACDGTRNGIPKRR